MIAAIWPRAGAGCTAQTNGAMSCGRSSSGESHFAVNVQGTAHEPGQRMLTTSGIIKAIGRCSLIRIILKACAIGATAEKPRRNCGKTAQRNGGRDGVDPGRLGRAGVLRMRTWDSLHPSPRGGNVWAEYLKTAWPPPQRIFSPRPVRLWGGPEGARRGEKSGGSGAAPLESWCRNWAPKKKNGGLPVYPPASGLEREP